MRVLVLGTYRDGELSRSHPFLDTLAALRRQRGVSRVELASLDDTGVLALMEATAGHGLAAAAAGLAHALHRETDGNPFFVSEVLMHLAETGALSQDSSGRWVGASSLAETVLPDSVREVIGARVGRLGQHAERVLSVAAVIGRDFDFDVLARATKTSDDDLLDALDSAAAAALVRELAGAPGRYSFAHALIQHALYEDLGPTRRARAHRHVAEALEDLCGDRPGTRVGELARHWFNATQPVELTKAISYSRLAGDAALAALAPADALRYYAQALDLYRQAIDPDPILGLDLAIGLSTAQRQTGDPAHRETLLDAARRAAALGETDRLVAAALANNRGFYSAAGVVDTDKVEILETALDRLTTDTPDRALVLATLCSELAHGSPLERRQALAEEALAIAHACRDDAVIVRVINSVFVPLHVPSLSAQNLDRTADALARAERLGDPALMLMAAFARLYVTACAGDFDERARGLEIVRSVVAQLDQPFFTHLYSEMLTEQALFAGDADLAERLAGEAFQLGVEIGSPDAAFMYGTCLLMVRHQRGTLGEMARRIQRSIHTLPALDPKMSAGFLAIAHIEADVLDRYDEADAYYARSAESCARAKAKFYAARTDLSWGKLLAERNAPGDTEKARDLLTRAHIAAAAHGYANVERRAAQALQDLD